MVYFVVSGVYLVFKLYGVLFLLLFGKLLCYVGVDFLLFLFLYGSVVLEKEEVFVILKYLIEDDVFFKKSFFVLFVGIYFGFVFFIVWDFGKDVVINVGGGIYGYLNGV